MRPVNDPILQFALHDLVQKHHCHTVILYGSRSRGDWTDESDYDLIGFCDEGTKFRDARLIEGKFLDAFVYPVSEVHENEKNFLHLRGGSVLLEQNGFGTQLLQKIDQVFRNGPPVLPEDELQAFRVWIEKMLVRISKGDLEGNYRRVWLQRDLLEYYFILRKQWYLDSKESFTWLLNHNPDVYDLFAQALKPNASDADLQILAKKVLEV